jgi:hypothetical protein
VWIDVLGPDRCRSDPCAPCTYWHLKKAALNGGRDRLSREQLEFVGVGGWAPGPTPGGWHQPDTLPAHLSPDAAMLRDALMDIEDTPGQERMRFLGADPSRRSVLGGRDLS